MEYRFVIFIESSYLHHSFGTFIVTSCIYTSYIRLPIEHVGLLTSYFINMMSKNKVLVCFIKLYVRPTVADELNHAFHVQQRLSITQKDIG